MNHTNVFSRCNPAVPKSAPTAQPKTGTRRKPRRISRTLAAAGLAALAAFATLTANAQIVIQPLQDGDPLSNGLPQSRDTKIYGSVPMGNFSSNLNISSPDIGAYFLALLQFDLSQLGAVNANDITSAFVTLYVSGLGPTSGSPSAIGGDVTLSEILNPWRETTDEPGAHPLATYDAFFGADPTLAFGSAVATQTITGAGSYTWDVTDTVKSWVDGSLANNGLFIQLATAGGDIGIADVDSAPGVSGSAPKLTVVPEPGSALLLGSAALLLGSIRRRRAH